MDYFSPWFWTPAALLLLIFGLALLGRTLRRRSAPIQARAAFVRQRSQLESVFFQTAARSGKPRGLRWKECQWENLIEFVREKETGRLLALVSVTLAFEAIEGGDMEGVEAVDNLRNASAVFFFQDGSWHTAGKAIFNLNPDEVIVHYHQGYERVEV